MKKKIAYLTATALACVTIFGAASCGNKGGDLFLPVGRGHRIFRKNRGRI